ncbi:MAG: hypothetical protein MUO34_11310 [Ignavibacteriaceae bacterium]|nr:hypothetical protein [Ignavibacteriaceae bacterium]
MFQLIRNKLNFREIRDIEIETEKSFQNFLKELGSSKLNLKFTLFDYLGFMLDEHIPIHTDRIGIINSIDIKKIDDILKEYHDGIKEIILDIKIGQRIPLYDPYPGIIPKTNLFRIFTIPTYKKDIPDVIEKLKVRLKDDDSFNRSLINCFNIIQTKSFQFEQNKEHLNELVQFYIYAVETETAEAGTLIDHFSSFILDQVKSLQPNSTIKLTEKLLLEIVDRFDEKLRTQDISIAKIETTLKFIYSMRNAALTGKSFLLISKLLSLLMHLFSKYVKSEFVTSHRIYSIILYIQEVAFSGIVYSRKNDDKRELLKYYNSFYLPLIRDAMDKASMAFYMLIKSSVKSEKSDSSVLFENAQLLINFLSPLNHWKPVEELLLEGSIRFKREYDNIVKSHGKNILHLAVLIFKYVREKKLPTSFLNQVSFPLADNCHTIKKFSMSSQDLLDEFFFNYEFRDLTSSFLQGEFEFNKIHESGAYSPIIYSFGDFWLTYSLYRDLIPQDPRRVQKAFVPSEDKSKTEFSKSMINNMIRRLQTVSVKDGANWLNKDEETVRRVMMKYGAHLRKLLE